MRRVIVAGALICLGISPSYADPLNWSGFSVSAGGGAAKTDTNFNAATSNTDQLEFPFFGTVDIVGQANSTSSVSDNAWHGFGTIQAGYDQRFGNFVVGGFADFDFYPDRSSTADASAIDGNLNVLFNGNQLFSFPISDFGSVSSNITLQNTWGVGGRLGYLVTPSILLYATGGYTQARLSGQVDLFDNVAQFVGFGPDSLTLNAPTSLNGYFIGAGGETKVADNLALRFEYRYANYSGEMSSATSTFSQTLFPGVIYSQKAQIHAALDEQIQTIRAALVWKLGVP